MRLAEGKELEDWQEYCYGDILKNETPWRIRLKVAGLQQARSQSVTWIPLSEALDNMLLYAEHQKQEKEPQDYERFKTAVVQAAVDSAILAPEQLEEPGQTVCFCCITKWQCARCRSLYCTFYLRRRQHSSTGGTSSCCHTTVAKMQ